MDNQRNKQTVNDEYNSQLVPKASTWVFQKWRRPTKNTASSTSLIHEQKPPEESEHTHNNRSGEYAQNRHSVHINVFANGSFLTMSLKTGLQIQKTFILTEKLCYHIQGWVERMMQWRQRQQQKKELVICIVRAFQAKSTVMKISVYFGALLVMIKYFKKTDFPEESMSFEVNEDYVQSHTDLIGNQRVQVCMLMEHLVTGKQLNATNNFRESCMAKRRFMDDKIYFWIRLPHLGDA
ncbi:hypothetical protein E3N88_32609 [Mikania micrantha]|uniref:Uncharacterized protein n=1 Tax=Mikania micrantha TaxID=192012 RepID=A0A5N6M8W6_9ASTR|nr:hypothetical protein E3N88_32609 [Mikania micrantha]